MGDVRLTWRRALARLRLVAGTVTQLGLPTLGLVAANSVRRQVVVWQSALVPHAAIVGQMPGRLRRVEPAATGARLEFEQAELEIHFLATDVVRLSWGPGPQPVPYALVGDAPWPAPDVVASTLADGGILLRSSELMVSVDGEGSVRMLRPDGTVLRTEAPPVRRGAAWELRHGMRAGEVFGGLGEQSAGIDLRGGRFELWNRDAGGSWGPGAGPLYLGIPVVVATHRDGDTLTFYENSTRAVFSFGESAETREPRGGRSAGMATVGFAGGVLRHYVMAGNVPHVLDRYSQLTGRPALPPRWALGYHQSRWGYKTEQDVRDVVDGYRSLGVPLSAVHLDIDYMDGYRVFTFDPARFPQPAALAAELSTSGVRLVTIVDPGVKVDAAYDIYREGLEGGLFCADETGRPVEGVVWPGRVVFPDFTDPGTRTWWAGHYRVLTDAGVAGIWHDMNEPTSISLLGDPSLPLSTRHDLDGRGGDHGEGHNLYGLLMNRAGFDGLRRSHPDRRPFIVSRSGWAGMQRWAWNWTGDVASTWASMRQQMATVVGLGLSGVPYSGPDIGGFSGVPDDELFLRWLQMSVLLPYCRTHSVLGAPPREPWRFDEPTRSTIVAWLRLRYRLLPYLYTLAHQAATTGAPLVRPLWWPCPDPGTDATDGEVAGGWTTDGQMAGESTADELTGDIDDAFLLGDALLVAPVTAPGASTRTLVLPSGRWRSIWADDADAGEGGSEVPLEAPADRMPILVRAGSIVPLDDEWTTVRGPCQLDADDDMATGPRPDGGGGGRGTVLGLDHAPRRLAFHCWPTDGGDARGRCVDDAGDGDGPVRRDALQMRGAVAGGSMVVTWERQGDFPAPASVRVVVHGLVADGAMADGEPVRVTGSSIECGPFSELRLQGARRAPGSTP
jgi:alpha-glucosidase